MRALRIDFAVRRGHEMVIEQEEGIMRSELDEIELHMLQAQQITGLLPVEWLDIDGNVRFYYHLAGRRMLSSWLRTNPLKMTDFYALLLAVVEILHACKHYMLQPEGFILQEQTIYIGERIEDISLTYLPLHNKELHGRENVASALQNLIVQWISYVDTPDGRGLQTIIRQLHGKENPWEQLRQTLVGLSGRSAENSAESSAAQLYKQTNADEARPPVPKPLLDESRSSLLDSFMNDGYRPGEEAMSQLLMEELRDSPLMAQKRPVERKSIYLLLGYVIAVAVIWRFTYMEHTADHMLLISAGLTLLATAALLLFWKKAKLADLAEQVQESNAEIVQGVPLQGEGVERERQSEPRFAVYHHHYSGFEEKGGAPIVAAGKSREEAVPPPADDATVLLADSTDSTSIRPEMDGNATPWLEREEKGKHERIEMNGKLFVIGRSEDSAQYVDHASGVSRAHLELLYENKEWLAKDIGSRNGSSLNGEAMIPYKQYRLQNGDIVQLAGENGPKYAFRAG
ncbi:DUF6382 domain-containing protein [Paenibacillus sp. GCM10027626]|uniref:DUF6382 domain-containing protein n=1 Tax=Paenibacillus sp. GCM10027626 TaxID=3273411 RepID=UPI00362CBD09